MGRIEQTRTYNVCDVCDREAPFLETCIVCRKEHCYACRALMAGCIIQPPVCRIRSKRDDVEGIVQRYADLILKLRQERDAALAALYKEASP